MALDISYGIYTIERLPKNSRRTPKWDLHSIAKDRTTAEQHAQTLAEQLYFDHVEVQEFKICPKTKKRLVSKIQSYSRKKQISWVYGLAIAAIVAMMVHFLF